MKDLIIDNSCFEREIALEKVNFKFIEDCYQAGEAFLLKEMLRNLYFLNGKFIKDINDFSYVIPNKINSNVGSEEVNNLIPEQITNRCKTLQSKSALYY